MDQKIRSKSPLRLTRQRQAILEELRKVKTHPTANEVYEMLRKRLPNISLGTVYRNLEILSENGLIQKLELAGTQKRFDGMKDFHYHARCVACGRVDDVTLDLMPIIDESAMRSTDYEIFSHRLEFIGLCPECSKKRGRASKELRAKPNSDTRPGPGKARVSDNR